jgi:hypothetical protein
MTTSSLTVCPTCSQPLTPDEVRNAFCFRCGKRFAGSRVVNPPPTIRVENAPLDKPSAQVSSGVLPRVPLLFLAAAFSLLSIGPPYPLIAVTGPVRFTLTTNVFCVTAAVLLAAAVTCSFYSKTPSSRLSSIAIALCAAAILVTTIWGIRQREISITSLINFVLCFMVAHIVAGLAREHAAATGRRSWQPSLSTCMRLLFSSL